MAINNILLSYKTNRRNFLKHCFILFAVLLSFPKLLSYAIENSLRTESKRLPLKPIENISLKSLNEKQAKMVQALANQIVPTDEDPGAYEAGVVLYIDDKISKSSELKTQYEDGVILVNRFSIRDFKKEFIDLTFEEQNSICEIMYKSDKKSKEFNFFNLIRAHTLEEFYTSKIAQDIFNLPGDRIISDYYK